MMITDQITDPVAVARSVKLRYVKSDCAGITRVRTRSGFQYFDADGNKVTDEETLERIRKLVLPPAWENVWICAWPNGHLQATGTDVKGRKQYRYHNDWAAVRNETKFFRLVQFAENLPAIRKKISDDLHQAGLMKEKVIAIAMMVMEETLIRVGNSGYEKLYGSHGLTTLRNKHVKITGGKAFFKFKGKKGVEHQIELRDAALARLLKKVQDIPGQSLFQYYDETGNHHSLDSGEVNDYIKSCCAGNDFTCKDFRTWAGTVHAFNLLADLPPYSTITECRKNIVGVIDQVAAKLGNTRAVCKKYYIHPQLLQHYEEGALQPWLQKLKSRRNRNNTNGLHADEKVLLEYLRQLTPGA